MNAASCYRQGRDQVEDLRNQIADRGVHQDFRTDVVEELGETRGKEAEFVERGVSARDLLDRIELRAPTSGVVHQLGVHTIGGVIRAGDTIMEIVPDTDELQVEARLQPGDIDQVRLGDKAFVRFSAFNQRTTPELIGVVSYVAADVSAVINRPLRRTSRFT